MRGSGAINFARTVQRHEKFRSMKIYPVIPSGDCGARLWPLSPYIARFEEIYQRA